MQHHNHNKLVNNAFVIILIASIIMKVHVLNVFKRTSIFLSTARSAMLVVQEKQNLLAMENNACATTPVAMQTQLQQTAHVINVILIRRLIKPSSPWTVQSVLQLMNVVRIQHKLPMIQNNAVVQKIIDSLVIIANANYYQLMVQLALVHVLQIVPRIKQNASVTAVMM